MDCNDVGWSLTNDATRDVGADGGVRDGHHRDRCVRGKPVRLIIAAGVIAHVVGIAEEERHRVKALDARTSHSYDPATVS